MFKILDTVVLDRDLPERSLRKGDLRAIVEIYEPDGLEVEFVTASGRTEALVTLKESDVRLSPTRTSLPSGPSTAQHGEPAQPAAAADGPQTARR